jgi:hypothetical protein
MPSPPPCGNAPPSAKARRFTEPPYSQTRPLRGLISCTPLREIMDPGFRREVGRRKEDPIREPDPFNLAPVGWK